MDIFRFTPFNVTKGKNPFVLMTLLVRDEVDIIRENIEYHLDSGVDFIIAMDNRSIDGTTDILKEFEKSGHLYYCYQSSDDFLQDKWVTGLARKASVEYKADWIINGDADEFYLPLGETLKQILKKVPSDIGVISIKRHDMIPFQRPKIASPPIEMIFRKKTSLEWVKGHPILDKIIHRGVADAQVAEGAHSVTSRFLPHAAPSAEIITFHYPIRSFEQFTTKVRNRGAGLLKRGSTASRYDYWYSSLLTGQLEQVYLTYQLDQDQIREKLSSGEIIEDHLLADVLTTLQRKHDLPTAK